MNLFLLITLIVLFLYYKFSARRYRSTDTVAKSYDDWTKDGILEFYWGEHIHLGYYGAPPQRRDFRLAKAELVHEMVRWGILEHLPKNATLLDVGCGIGGSSRILAREYGFSVTAITISPGQVERAKQLTEPEFNIQFLLDDAQMMSFPSNTFDVVWSVEAEPHISDKAKFAQELMRVLKPGGKLIMASWNQRDDRQKPLSFWEKIIMRQLLEQWSHPAFSSIEVFSELLKASNLVEGEVVTQDWTKATLPSWIDSIWQGIIRPEGLSKFGLSGSMKAIREIPTLLLMRLAFGIGLCRFGIFYAAKENSNYSA